MGTVSGGPAAADGPPASAPAPPLPEVPVPADGIELIGQARGSGYRKPPSLVRRADGQMLQLTPLLYAVLAAIDGSRTVEQVAQQASAGFGRLVTAENVRTLIRQHLLPLGLLQLADGSQPQLKRAAPLLGMRLRYTVTDPERTRRITAPFAVLFNPLIVLAVTALFLAASWWVLMVKGLASATHDAFASPGLLLLVFAVTVLSAGFHEFGHAAAARRGGATPGAMGMGLYLIWPAFYTDVTDSYRLGRAGRIRTDLGGLYFNALVAVGIMGLWWPTHYDALLLVVATQILQMVRQLLPLVRFDGYHILADATGVPDLFQRIKPTLLGLLPWRWKDPESTVLKPWARAVVTGWVLVTVPLLLFSLAMMVLALPRLLGTAWKSAVEQQAMLAAALDGGDVLGAAGRVLALAAVALPAAATAYLLGRLVRRTAEAVWRKTSGKPARRATAAAAAVAVAAGLAWAWWPDAGNYRPVQRYEHGTVLDAAASLVPGTAGSTGAGGLAEGRSGEVAALWPDGTELPTRDEPRLAMVLVPQQDRTGPGVASAAGRPAAASAPAWVFPFDKPPAPARDGNQALAVNTRDGSVVYSVAFALVWAGDGPVDAANEAYAFASCDGCAAVAVGFQVVLVLGQADVVVPENLAAAANYNCVDCLTYALASQLVTTLDGPLSDAGMAELTALWEKIAEFGRHLQDYPLSEIQARLNGFKAQLLELIERDTGTGNSTGSGAEPEGTASPGPAGTPAPENGTAPLPSGGPGTADGQSAPASQPPAPVPATAPQEEPAAPTPAPSAPPDTQAPSAPPDTQAPPQPTAPAGTPAATTPQG